MSGPPLGPIRLLRAPFRVDHVYVRVSPGDVGDRTVNTQTVGHEFVEIANRVPVQFMVEDGHYDVRIVGTADFFHYYSDDMASLIPKTDVVFRDEARPQVDWAHVALVLALVLGVLLTALAALLRRLAARHAAPCLARRA